MMAILKRIVKWAAVNSCSVRRCYALFCVSRLVSTFESYGFIQSQIQSEPVNRHGEPLAWLPYPVISFLEPRIQSYMNVFEFGSGNSTLWWSHRVNKVVSCEHDPVYYFRMQQRMPNNVEYKLKKANSSNEYTDSISDYTEAFDVVIIDGVQRVKCTQNCLRALKKSGVVIFDNSDREEYRQGLAYLAKNGFKSLDLEGFCSLQTWINRTSIFYKENNCLKI